MKFLTLFFMLFMNAWVFGQSILQEYISTGIQNNLALLQKQDNYRQSLEKLREARGLFYPSVTLNSRYTLSEGGRVIDFPVGDLLNDVYDALDFPIVLENQQIAFLRPTEHETRLRFVQQIFNSDIYYNAKIRHEAVVSEEISLEQYKRELIIEIKKAYYTVGMSGSVLSMLQQTRELLTENVRVNSKLLENDKITRDILFRSQTELYKFDQQLSIAMKNKTISVAYFNFLLNRPLKDSVIMESPPDWTMPLNAESEYIRQAVGNREEIRSLQQYGRINDLSTAMNRAGKFPDVLFVADYGFQGEKYKFNKDQDYLQASAVLTWDIFGGMGNRSRIKQSLIIGDIIDKQLDEAGKKIALQVINGLEELRSAKAGYIAAGEQVQSAREGFRLLNRRYQEGQASLIEFLDARSSLTGAEENLIIQRYACLSKYAEFENILAVN